VQLDEANVALRESRSAHGELREEEFDMRHGNDKADEIDGAIVVKEANELVVLREENEALRMGKDALREENEALRMGKDALREENEALRMGKDALREENEALRSERDTAKSKATQLSDSLREIEFDHSSVIEELETRLETAVGVETDLNQLLRTRAIDSGSKQGDLKTEVERLESELDRIKASVAPLVSEAALSQKNEDSYKAEIVALKRAYREELDSRREAGVKLLESRMRKLLHPKESYLRSWALNTERDRRLEVTKRANRAELEAQIRIYKSKALSEILGQVGQLETRLRSQCNLLVVQMLWCIVIHVQRALNVEAVRYMYIYITDRSFML